MPTFHLQHPDGSEWEFDAPDMDSAVATLHQARPTTWGDVATDVAKTIPSSIARGAIGAAAELAKSGQLESEQRAMGFDIPGSSKMPEMPTPEQAKQSVSETLGLHQPWTETGKFVETPGEFVGDPKSYIGGGGAAAKLAQAILSGTGANVGEYLTQGANQDSLWGKLVKATGPTLGAIAGGGLATPFPAKSAQRVEDTQFLNSKGVPTDMGQNTGNRMIRSVVNQLGNEAFPEMQRHEYIKAAFREVGEDIGDKQVDDGVVNKMMARVGKAYDDVGKRNVYEADEKTNNELKNIENTYNQHTNPGTRPSIVENTLEHLKISPGQAGMMTGTAYQAIRSGIRADARTATGQEKIALNKIADTLDSTMERSIAKYNPADLGVYRQTNDTYKKALALQDWAGTIGGEQKMTPYKLGSASQQYYNQRAGYAKGYNPFKPLADAGTRILNKDPDSWTATHANVEKGLSGTGAALGAALAGTGAATFMGAPSEHAQLMHFLQGDVLGAGLGSFALRPAASALLTNRYSQGYLGNQAIPQYDFPARIARAIAQTQGQ